VMMMKSEVKEIENGVGVGCIVDAFSLSRERERRGGERMCEMYRYGRHKYIIGTPTQLPQPPLSSSSNSDLLAPRHLPFTSDANLAMPHVPVPHPRARTGPPLV